MYTDDYDGFQEENGFKPNGRTGRTDRLITTISRVVYIYYVLELYFDQWAV